MSDTTSTEIVPAEPSTFEKGSWQAALAHSAKLHEKSASDRKRAGVLLWQASTSAIGEWDADTDANAETLAGELLSIMGASRKGDVSKIKTVALAVRNHGLVTSVYKNLSQAYTEANRLTKTVAVEAAQDDAAEAVVEKLAEAAPKSATTAESAALILLSKGIDGAVVAILDALGKDEAVHRAFMRAVSTEIAARVQAAKPKPAPKPTVAEKNAAKRAEAGTKPARATAKDGAAKAKPVSASKGDPNKKVLPPKAVKAKPDTDKGAPVSEPVDAGTQVAEPVVDAAAEPKPEPTQELLDLFEEYEQGEGQITEPAEAVETGAVETEAVEANVIPVADEPVKPKARRRPVAVKA